MNRRSLLKLLLALPIAATLDVEKLLWVPTSMVTVPRRLTIDEINAVTLKHIMPGIVDSFFKNDPLLAYIRDVNKYGIRPMWSV